MLRKITRKLLKLFGESGLWRAIGRLHTRLYRASGGRLGLHTPGLEHLLLTTTGRKSGRPRTSPVTFLREGDSYLVVASNGGADRHPAWWLNLEAEPHAWIEVGSEKLAVIAKRADPDEEARLWGLLEAYNPFYSQYRQITIRDIPIVVLCPVGSGA